MSKLRGLPYCNVLPAHAHVNPELSNPSLPRSGTTLPLPLSRLAYHIVPTFISSVSQEPRSKSLCRPVIGLSERCAKYFDSYRFSFKKGVSCITDMNLDTLLFCQTFRSAQKILLLTDLDGHFLHECYKDGIPLVEASALFSIQMLKRNDLYSAALGGDASVVCQGPRYSPFTTTL